MPEALPDWLRRRSETHREVVALLAGERCWTFSELDRRVDDAARALAGAGIRDGARVALLARNTAAFVVTVHALGRLGAVVVPLNLRLTASELGQQLRDAEVRALWHDAPHASLAAAAAAGGGIAAHELGTDGPQGERDANATLRAEIDLDAAHSVIFTSGTTGRAKGAELTWGNFWWSAVGGALNLGHHRDDRWLAAMPLFHVGGLSIVMRSLIYGIGVVLHDGFDPERVNRAIDEDRVTIVSVVAVMLQRMLDARGRAPYPPALRCVMAGGGPVAPALLERALDAGVPVALTYGLTESCSQVATLAPEETRAHLGSVGRPLLPMEVRIDGEDGPLPAGEIGEIVLRGPSVIRRYLGADEATAHAWRGGWFHTGDLGSLDADGYLTIVDRRDDLIVSGGENVYPAEIEDALAAHPDVIEAGVIGIPDAQWGSVPVAIVRTRVPLEEASLVAFLGSRLARYKVPRTIVFAEAPLPRTAAGKLQRRKLAGGLIE